MNHKRSTGGFSVNIVFIFLLCSLVLGCSDNPEWQDQREFGEAELDNGLRIVTITDRRVPIVMQMLWYLTGGRDDLPGQSGMAHLFEHLMFQETDTLADDEFSKTVARLGGVHNAFTAPDFTGYYQHVPRNQLEKVMALEASRMCHLRLSDASVLIERKIVVEERSQRVDARPPALLDEKINAALFAGHPYAIPTIGWRDEVSQITPDQARTFYRQHYAPNNAILVLFGDIDIAVARDMAERYYSSCPRREIVQNFYPYTPQPLTPKIALTHPTTERREPYWKRIYRLPRWTPENARIFAALDVLMHVLVASDNSRLINTLIFERELVNNVTGNANNMQIDMGTVEISFSANERHQETKIATIIDAEIKRFKSEKISQKELKRAKFGLTSEFLYASDSQSFAAQIYGIMLSIGRPLSAVNDWLTDVNNVTPDDVQRAAQEFLAFDQSLTGYLEVKP